MQPDPRARIVPVWAAFVLLGACDAPSDVPDAPAAPVTFHCAGDSACPEITIAGAPSAPYPTHPFHGVGDPSLERGSDGALYLSYSHLTTTVTPPAQIDFTVGTHLARSDDGGRTFQFVRAVNAPTPFTHWTDGRAGILQHEVSTLVRSDGAWELMWFSYFDELDGGPAIRSDFWLETTTAPSLEELGATVTADLRGTFTTPAVGGISAASIPGLEDCAVLTEPALFFHDRALYLATSCLVVEGAARVPDRERLVLLRREAAGYRLLGSLLTASDARAFGVDAIEQADLSIARDGSIVLIATPLILEADPTHRGCIAMTVTDLDRAMLARDDAGVPVLRARITADGNALGPGLCTYDAASETGVMVVIVRVDTAAEPPSFAFSLHATGVHP